VRRLASALLAVIVLPLVAAAAWGVPSAGSLRSPTSEIVQFGYIKSLKPKGGAFELRFDPALWLGGETANRAAIEDGVIAPGETVPNDYYIRNPEHSLLTYRVPRNVPVTVVTVRAAVGSTRITVAELAAIVKGRNPKHRPLIERGPRRYLGYWIRVRIDTVRAIDQQYQP